LQGKIVSRRNVHGNEEESQEEETLTGREGEPRHEFIGLSREAPLEGLLILGIIWRKCGIGAVIKIALEKF
jgi:hypothetical protein